MRLGFSFTNLPNVNKLLHERLIFRCELHVVAAKDVGAAVADLNQIEHVVLDRSTREGRAHPGTARVLLAAMMNRKVRIDGRVAQVINQRSFIIA